MIPKLHFPIFALFTLLASMPVFAGTNPFLASADAVVSCPNDGSQFPTIRLCGAGDARLIQINDPLVQSAQWQLLDGNSCATGTQDCPNLGMSCTWNTVETGNSFTLNNGGEYRVLLTYASAPTETFYATATQTTYTDVISIIQPISSNGGSNGSIALSVTGNSGPYIHQLYRNGTLSTPFQSSPTFSGLAVGMYQIRTRDSSGICEHYSAMVDLTEPEELVGQLVQTQVPTCAEGGTIEANVTGGEPPYQYALNGGAYVSAKTFTNLPAGSYVVEVIDANANLATTNGITITDPAPVDAIFTQYDVSCFGADDGRIEVQAAGGTGNYQYQLQIDGITNPYQSSNVFEGLAPGVYDIFVQDSGGCVLGPNSIVIEEPLALDNSVTVVDATGNGSQDGHITITTSGGTAPYQYSISPNLNEFYTSNEFGSLGPGSYTILVQDQNGCVNNVQVVITEPSAVTAKATVIYNAGCSGSGAIEVSATGGVPPYELSIDSSVSYTPMSGNPSVINDLSPGTYQIRIRDANGYIGTSNVTITDFSQLTVDLLFANDITCNGAQDGRFSLGAQGGDGNYSFQLSDVEGTIIRSFQTSTVFDNLNEGAYVIDVIDSNGCAGTSFVYGIREAAVFIVDNISSQGDTYMPNTGSISFDITGGAAPYSYSINASAFVSFDDTNKTITDLAAGDHIVTVRDAFGCESIFTQTIATTDAVVPLTADIIITNSSCAGNLDGSIQVNNTLGGSGNYVYAIDTIDITQAQASNKFTGIADGSHYVSIFDSSGYMKEIAFELTSPEALEITAEVIYSDDTTTITASAQGGTLPYSYFLNGSESQEANFFENLSPGRYLVQIHDANGCITMTVVVIDEKVDTDGQNIDVFQNPGRTEVIDIVFKETQNSETTIAIYNSRGNRVFSSEIDQGTSQTQIDVNNLSRGIYFIYIKNAEMQEIKKVMIL